MNEFNLRLINPIIMYSQKNEAFLMTPYFEPERVHLVSDLRNEDTKKTRITKKQVERIEKTTMKLWELFTLHGISWEDRIFNTFYEPKTNTLWLFDL